VQEQLLKTCKKEIENQLAWPPSATWKQRDYKNLIRLIEEKTGILLSLSTSKRIWADDYSGNPHPATLDALAQYLNYQDWLDFSNHHQSETPRIPQPKPSKQSNHKIYLAIAAMGIILIVLLAWAPWSGSDSLSRKRLQNTGEAIFKADNTVKKGVPNTVIFRYDVSKIEADSFAIQQSWNAYRRKTVAKTDSIFTSQYYFPGVHHAKLFANDSVIKTATLRINTDGWTAIARKGYKDNVPRYFELAKEVNTLQISAEALETYKETIAAESIMCYYNIGNFDFEPTNFEFATTLNLEKVANITCPTMGVMIYGEHDFCMIPLTQKGCESNLQIKLGEDLISGKVNDLSGFTTHVYEPQELKIQFGESQIKIMLDSDLILAHKTPKNLGRIAGAMLYFYGYGIAKDTNMTRLEAL
tara:strand:+ start:1379 stop:2620 length:1242 start_codon:yes stop_codon:yes gene_type:complete